MEIETAFMDWQFSLVDFELLKLETALLKLYE
jgi:hypothetical protein